MNNYHPIQDKTLENEIKKINSMKYLKSNFSIEEFIKLIDISFINLKNFIFSKLNDKNLDLEKAIKKLNISVRGKKDILQIWKQLLNFKNINKENVLQENIQKIIQEEKLIFENIDKLKKIIK
ncbi:hypothetical protein [Spiroplasma taiwanense]|uniref:Uncharacterized protein n=1 Tax=Spiroplasma taiwanense CT-1 TaxID=1276220 RepID=S5LYS1_9MOLU|nr:hypothetical protein [Spiroplasma taiwanense]AGR40827.1 hypothetical protein STAIW_v1c01410 [Spiroplasma taiwanense CT-1]